MTGLTSFLILEPHNWSLASLSTTLLLLTILYLTILSLYRLTLHPLASHPGPLLNKLTTWPTLSASLRGESTFTRHLWALQYGPGPVRIGPNELLFSDLPSVKDIYGQSSQPCLKDPDFYGPFTVCGARNVFNSFERHEHARIRRGFAHAFSVGEVRRMQARVSPIIDKCLGLLSSRGGEKKGESVDLFEPFSRLFVDIISELSFDASFDTLGGNLLTEAGWADQLQNVSALRGMMPWVEWLPVEFVQEAVRARPLMIEFARKRIEEFRERLRMGMVREGSLLKKVVETGLTIKEEGVQPLTDVELMENAIVFIQAGSETTMSTLLYLVYEVDRHPAVKERLVKEIREACGPADVNTIPAFESIQHLPYLNQVLEETLRLHGPIPVNLPRISPGKTISTTYVPAGTRVCNLAYTTHRHEHIFPSPESFVPERWERPTDEMKLAFRPFSTGPRNCIGLHLARMDLMLATCALYNRFDLKLDETRTTPAMMVPQDRGVMSPQGKKVYFFVSPRK